MEGVEIKCPYCDSEDYSLFGWSENGMRRYRCKSCKRTYIVGGVRIRRSAVTGVPCPRCGSEHVIRNGYKRGKQTYRCIDCNRRFNLFARKELTNDDKRVIMMYKFNLNIPTKDIAEHLKVSKYLVDKYVKECIEFMQSKKYKRYLKVNRQKLKVTENRIQIMRGRKGKWYD